MPLTQVNESHLKSIVTQPWQNNYVYASGFDVLPLVRNLVLSKACRVLVTAGTTVITTTVTTTTGQPSPSTPRTTTTPLLSTTTIDNRGGDRPLPNYDGKFLSTLVSDVQLSGSYFITKIRSNYSLITAVIISCYPTAQTFIIFRYRSRPMWTTNKKPS